MTQRYMFLVLLGVVGDLWNALVQWCAIWSKRLLDKYISAPIFGAAGREVSTNMRLKCAARNIDSDKTLTQIFIIDMSRR